MSLTTLLIHTVTSFVDLKRMRQKALSVLTYSRTWHSHYSLVIAKLFTKANLFTIYQVNWHIGHGKWFTIAKLFLIFDCVISSNQALEMSCHTHHTTWPFLGYSFEFGGQSIFLGKFELFHPHLTSFLWMVTTVYT